MTPAMLPAQGAWSCFLCFHHSFKEDLICTLPQYIRVQQGCCQNIKGHAPHNPHISVCSRRSGHVEPTPRMITQCSTHIGAPPCNIWASTGGNSSAGPPLFARFILHHYKLPGAGQVCSDCVYTRACFTEELNHVIASLEDTC